MAYLTFERLNSLAILPSRGSVFAAGLDIHSIQASTISPGERLAIPTGLSVAIPEGFYGRIAPRSGLAIRQGLDVLAGVIDADYRGEILCILINLGNEIAQIEIGDRIAQLIIEQFNTLTPVWSERLSPTLRGRDGFGSSGLR